jgi:nicotinic acid mononucleotide adenylyltransferase
MSSTASGDNEKLLDVFPWPLSKLVQNYEESVISSTTTGSPPNNGYAVLLLTGALNPIHRAHLHALEASKAAIERDNYEVIGGFISPSHDKYVQPKMRAQRLDPKNLDNQKEYFGLEAKHRIECVKLALANNKWIDVGYWESSVHQKNWPDYPEVTRELACYLRDSVAQQLITDKPITVFFVCGTDHYMKCDPGHSIAFERTKTMPIELGVIVVSRNDSSPYHQQQHHQHQQHVKTSSEELHKEMNSPIAASKYELCTYFASVDDVAPPNSHPTASEHLHDVELSSTLLRKLFVQLHHESEIENNKSIDSSSTASVQGPSLDLKRRLLDILPNEDVLTYLLALEIL